MWNFLNLETPCGLNKTLGGHSTAWARLLSRTQLKSLGGREAAGLWSRQHGAVGMIWSSTHLTLHLPKACSACTGPCPPHPPPPTFFGQSCSLTPVPPACPAALIFTVAGQALMPPSCHLWFCCFFIYLSALLVLCPRARHSAPPQHRCWVINAQAQAS